MLSVRSVGMARAGARAMSAGRLEGYKKRMIGGDLPEYVRNAPATQQGQLGNKMRVVSQAQPGETVAVGLFVDAGSSYETASNNGVAHFLEHMAFKGTSKRSQAEIEKLFENIGGHLNAYTTRDHTVYFANVFKDDLATAIDVLGDIVQNSVFPQDALEQERMTILHEMLSVEEDAREVAFDHLHAVAFRNHPLGQTILGPEANIRSIGREDLRKYVTTHYTGPRMALVATGAVDQEQLLDLAEKSFGGVSSEVRHDYASEARPDFVGSTALVRDERHPLVHNVVALEGPGLDDPEMFTFLVMEQLAGRWENSSGVGRYGLSRTAEKLATGNLAHSFETFYHPYRKTALFGAYMVCDPNTVPDATHEVVTEWARMGTSASDFEVEVAKNQVKSSILVSTNDNTSIMEDLGRQTLAFGRVMSMAEMVERIDAIDAARVRAVAAEYFHDTDPAAAAVGPVDSARYPEYNLLRSWTSWWRL